jgi:hypothetical protein
MIINELPLEEYLYSVVPSEMPWNYNYEALKAQAICARSFAYKHVMSNSYSEFGAHVDDSTAYQTLKARYLSWKQLFRPNHGNLTESEIMGLIGELLFLRDTMIPQKGIEAALESWTGPERTHKDFSFENEWFEIKSISFGKESVHISSIEQLDGTNDGCLVVYSLERMSPSFNGLKLNKIVDELINILEVSHLKDFFLAKLNLYGFDFSPHNDNLVYDLRNKTTYKVCEGSFPRLKRESLPDAIIKAQYDINLSDIESFKIQEP